MGGRRKGRSGASGPRSPHPTPCGFVESENDALASQSAIVSKLQAPTLPDVSDDPSSNTNSDNLIPNYSHTLWEISLFDNSTTHSQQILAALRNLEAQANDPTVDSHFIGIHGTTSSAAFFEIARILNLSCQQNSGFNITAPAWTIPTPMKPTLNQEIIPHKPYVDMLPWKSMRDKLLRCANTINETEFVIDMVNQDLRIWGTRPWDPRSWEVGPVFAEKWWFLMDEDIIETSNFWRSQRGVDDMLPGLLSLGEV
jgi:hypothetical protein